MAADTFNPQVSAPTVAERVAAGKERRASCPRTTLARWEPAPERPDPVSIIEQQGLARVSALLPIRYSRMSASPFAFYRGTAAIMAADLASADNSGLQAQLCGDAHVANFGLFASPERSVVFDVNDFDETCPGPCEWDVARLTTSILLACRENGYSERQCETITRIVPSSYRSAMARFAEMNDLDVWYSRVDAGMLTSIGKAQAGAIAKTAVTQGVRAAMQRDRWSAIRKLTISTDQGRRFVNQPPFLVPLSVDSDWWKLIDTAMLTYQDSLPLDRQRLLSRYRAIDLAHKVVGVGSVGLRAYVILLQGRDDDDLLVLQAKEAVTSVVAMGLPNAPVPRHQGERVVIGQRLMQAATDIFLGWTTGPQGRDYYVRQLRDMKWSPDLSTMSPAGLRALASSCGETLARAHARSGDAIAICGYLGSGSTFDDALTTFAYRYAEQVTEDFARFQAALNSGRLTATPASPAPDSAALGDQIRAGLRAPSSTNPSEDPKSSPTPA
ncbi:MAG: DUF2252 domain-containing protein [Actinomycetales bacterium]